jgi:folate-binding protein YgfZ
MKGAYLDRRFIYVKGADAKGFLQGLLTQDLEKVTLATPQYSLMLTPQGRFAFDMFIIADAQGYLLECSVVAFPALLHRLKMYGLRSKVSLEPGPEWRVGVAFEAPEAVYVFQDPRCAKLPWRFYEDKCAPRQDFSHWDYDAYLFDLGIPQEKDLIFEKSVPLECWMEELNGLSFEKGCYLGQELTARTKHRGQIHKRLVPGRGGAPLAVGAPLFDPEKAEIGKIYTRSVADFGFFARVNWDAVKDALNQQNVFYGEKGEPLSLNPVKFLDQ